MDIKSTLGKIAPIIAGAAGGPLAAAAVTAITDVLGVTGKSPVDIDTALQGATPDQIEQIKRLDYEFALKQMEVQRQLEELANADRANARQREIVTGDHATPRAYAIAVVLGFFGVVALMIFQELPASGRDSLLVLIGALGASFTNIGQYYFGSSSGSSAKQKQLDALRGRQ